ncbi:MAG: hypothetical protein HY557_05325 [Euryarchaeota archaeon]|nr:hypothetical protein [Euryarchaeota archaeon]
MAKDPGKVRVILSVSYEVEAETEEEAINRAFDVLEEDMRKAEFSPADYFTTTVFK